MTEAASIVILAAGLGTRLRPLTEEVAKVLVPIGDRPLLDHLHAQLARGARVPFALNTHHLGVALAAEAARLGARVSDERDALRGTAGGLRALRELVGGGVVLAFNGDIFAPDFATPALLLGAGALVTLLVEPRAAGEGNVGLDGHDRIVRLRDQRFGAEVAGGYSLGVQIVSPEVALPADGCLVADVYLPLLARGARLDVARYTRPWFDVGSLEGYVAANRHWLLRRVERAPTEVLAGSYLAPDVQIDASCTQSIVGRGARVEAPIDGCIVWPGVHVTAPAARAIITPRRVVPMPPAPPHA